MLGYTRSEFLQEKGSNNSVLITPVKKINCSQLNKIYFPYTRQVQVRQLYFSWMKKHKQHFKNSPACQAFVVAGCCSRHLKHCQDKYLKILIYSQKKFLLF